MVQDHSHQFHQTNQHSKITLSQKEMELVTNADWILTKNAIMQKVKWLLEDVQAAAVDYATLHVLSLPEEVVKPSPKISRGENYKGLPYLVLDYPRYFQKENLPGRPAGIFAIRCMFWWGNFFSITLHLSGSYQKQLSSQLVKQFSLLKESDYYLSVADDEWEHHFESSNYIPVNKFNEEDFRRNIMSSSFTKIAKHFPLAGWDDASQRLNENFRLLVNICAG